MTHNKMNHTKIFKYRQKYNLSRSKLAKLWGKKIQNHSCSSIEKWEKDENTKIPEIFLMATEIEPEKWLEIRKKLNLQSS